MSNVTKKAILRALVEGVLTDLMVQTKADNVYLDDTTTVAAKLALAEECRDKGIPLVSAMGCGNKLDPSRFRTADIADTRVCPLCRVMRRELKKRGIPHLPVVFSDEPPRRPGE